MEETFKRYELLCKDVKYQIDFINDYYEFDFKHLEETLNEMKSLQKRILLAKETLIIRIGGCLHENGRISLIPYPKDRRLKIRKQGERFYTITDLKKYYGIKKTTKTGEKEWAISPRGKRYEWDVLEAEISMEYIAL